MNTNLIKFLLALRNSSLSKREVLIVEHSQIREKIVRALYSEGFVQSFKLKLSPSENLDQIWIKLRYCFDKSQLKYLKVFSKPSHTKYMKLADLSNIPDKKFVIFFSTDLGFLTSLECKKKRVGGKLLFIC
jgi:ribosomal protein S8